MKQQFVEGDYAYILWTAETAVAAMRVSNEDCPDRENPRRDAALTPTSFAEIVSDDFPVLHLTSSVAPFRRKAWLSITVFLARARRRAFGSADHPEADQNRQSIQNLPMEILGKH
jgi:hypothetical protein